MAIDLNALRAKHEQLNNPQAGNSNSDFLKKFYQIPEGSNAVRILPWKDEEREFYAETKIHRVTGPDGNVKNHHCRKVHGENCPICDVYYALWKTGRKEDEDLARQIKPRARYYMNILDRESGDVKILSVGVILFKKIIGAMLDEDFGDITDTAEGHDFKIVKEMDGQWPKYDQSQPRPKASPLGSNSEIASIMESVHEIHDLVKLEDYEEFKQVADSLISPTQGVSRNAPEAEETSDNDYLSKLQS
jgi:hypothetical protein|tara:strand:- start:594 stop:1334 length:741 start_codon:yes stop_codon:yes gene_type:complete